MRCPQRKRGGISSDSSDGKDPNENEEIYDELATE